MSLPRDLIERERGARVPQSLSEAASWLAAGIACLYVRAIRCVLWVAGWWLRISLALLFVGVVAWATTPVGPQTPAQFRRYAQTAILHDSWVLTTMLVLVAAVACFPFGYRPQGLSAAIDAIDRIIVASAYLRRLTRTSVSIGAVVVFALVGELVTYGVLSVVAPSVLVDAFAPGSALSRSAPVVFLDALVRLLASAIPAGVAGLYTSGYLYRSEVVNDG